MAASRVAIGLLACALLSGCEGTAAPPRDTAAPSESPTPAPEPTPPSAESILAAHVQAIGGPDAIARVESLVIESTIELAAKNLRGTATMWWTDGKYRVVEAIEGLGTTSAGFDGRRVWRDDAFNGARELDGGEAELYRRGSSPFLVADWQQYFERAELLGSREVDGETWDDLRLTSASGSSVVMSFDRATQRLTEMAFDEVTARATRRIVTRNEDYRAVGDTGALLPHRVVTRAPVGETVQVIQSVRVGEPLEPGLFASPLGEDRVPADPGLATTESAADTETGADAETSAGETSSGETSAGERPSRKSREARMRGNAD
jgi:hypothetical protein